jgi:hypothetical protein
MVRTWPHIAASLIPGATGAQGGEYMPIRFTIYKSQPASGRRVVLHHRIPEQMAEWLCQIAECELSAEEKAGGWVIIKESEGLPVQPAVNRMQKKAS